MHGLAYKVISNKMRYSSHKWRFPAIILFCAGLEAMKHNNHCTMNIFSVFSLYSSLEFRLLNGKEAYFIDFMWFTFYAKSDLSTSDTYFYLLALPKYQMSEASNWNQTWRILNPEYTLIFLISILGQLMRLIVLKCEK